VKKKWTLSNIPYPQDEMGFSSPKKVHKTKEERKITQKKKKNTTPNNFHP